MAITGKRGVLPSLSYAPAQHSLNFSLGLSRSGLVLGSNFPAEEMNPFVGIHAAVTREDTTGQPAGGWLPTERLTVDQAVRGFTINAAYASFQEEELGSITPGKWADFIIVDQDPYQIAPSDILRTRVLATYFGGDLVTGQDFSVDPIRISRSSQP